MKTWITAALAGTVGAALVRDPLSGTNANFAPLFTQNQVDGSLNFAQKKSSSFTVAKLSTQLQQQVVSEAEGASANKNPNSLETRAITPRFGMRIQSPDPAITALSFARAATDPSQILTCASPNATLTTSCMTHQDYQETTNHVQDILNAFSGADRADFAGCILRMAGHDLMDFDRSAPVGEKGGSDGCIDFNDGDNAGLAACLQQLQPAYDLACEQISLADFLVIAGEAVMEATAESPIGFENNFRYGRTTSQGCAWAIGRLPNPEHGCDDVPNSVKTVFVDALELTWDQSAALMGVHTLGRADPANSGYDGWWSEPTNQGLFNNDFYKSLIDKGWTKVTQSNPAKRQWDRSDTGTDPNNHEMMLSSDMCLAYSSAGLLGGNDGCCAWAHFGQQDPPSLPHCNSMNSPSAGNGNSFGQDLFNCCGPNPGACVNPSSPQGPALSKVLAYAGDNNVFMSDFKVVWKKTTENGFEASGVLHSLQSTCDDATPVPTKHPTPVPDTHAPTQAPTHHVTSPNGCCEVTPAGITAGFDCTLPALAFNQGQKCKDTHGLCAWNDSCGGCCVPTAGAIASGLGATCGSLAQTACVGDICTWDADCVTPAPTPVEPTPAPTQEVSLRCCIGDTASTTGQCVNWFTGFVSSQSHLPPGSVDWEGRCNGFSQLPCHWDTTNPLCGATPTHPPAPTPKETSHPTPAPGPPTCWTPWFDRDNPSGTGDWESFATLSQEHAKVFIDAGCTLGTDGLVLPPLGVQCQEAQTSQPWNSFGDNFANGAACTPEGGIVCVTRDQAYGTCHDYKVRFNCCESDTTNLGGVLTFHEHTDKCEMTMSGGKVASTCDLTTPNSRALSADVASLIRTVQSLQQEVADLRSQLDSKDSPAITKAT